MRLAQFEGFSNICVVFTNLHPFCAMIFDVERQCGNLGLQVQHNALIS